MSSGSDSNIDSDSNFDSELYQSICDIRGHQYSGGICVDCYQLQRCNFCGNNLDLDFCFKCDAILCFQCKTIEWIKKPDGNKYCKKCKKD